MKKMKRKTGFNYEKRWFKLCFLVLMCCIIPLNILAQSGRTVKGTVADESGEPLIGARVTLVNDKKVGVITDVDGNFTLAIPQGNVSLEIAMIGFASKTVPVGNQTEFKITLSETSQDLDEVVVVGFQTQKKVNLTGAINSVGKDVFENRPVVSVGQALQGVMPNLNITISDGTPNKVPDINLRGGTSLREVDKNGEKVFEMKYDAPLILVDGVEISPEQLNQMNPNDIDNISLLKDASAAAIYGTKASGGVMLITTKSGKFDQKAVISYGFDISWDKAANIPDILDSYSSYQSSLQRKVWKNGIVAPNEYERLEGMARYRDNPTPGNAYLPNKTDIIWVANTNPFDIMIKNWAPTVKHNFSVSGGSSAVSYYISLGLVDQAGIYKYESNDYKRYNGTVQLNAKVAKWFNLGTRIMYNETKYSNPSIPGGKGTIWNAMKGGEVERNIYTPLTTGPNDLVPNAVTENVLNYLLALNEKSRNTNTILTVSPEFIIIPKELKVKADFSFMPTEYRYRSVQAKQERVFTSWESLKTDYTQYNNAYEHKTSTRKYTLNIYGEYNKSLSDKHNINVLLGFNQEYGTYAGNELFYERLISPYIISAEAVEDPSLVTFKNDAEEETARAVFGRITYNYMQRYLLTIDGRYDGSSKFTKNDRFKFFPTFSVGWRMSEEDFMASSRSWIDNLKLRASWGRLGRQGTNLYPYQQAYGTGNANYILNGSYLSSLKAPALVSPTLTWERTRTINGGLDWTLFNNRFDGSFDYYNRYVDDILVKGDTKLPALLGAEPPEQNSGAIETKGWELSFSWRDRLPNGISYRVGVNIGDNYSIVEKFSGNSGKLLSNDRPYNGKRIGEIWGYETGGILQESDFNGKESNGNPIYNGPDQSKVGGTNLFPGMIWYKDRNGDGKIDNGSNTADNPGDMIVIGNNTPRYRYGISGDISYKGFDFNFLFNGIGKRDVWLSGSYWGDGAGSRWMLDRSWTPDRLDAKYPMYQGGGMQVQSGYIVNGAYLRLKQLMLGYTLPKNVTKKIGANKLRVSLSGYNIFEISKVSKNYEVDTLSDQYPITRTVSLGAQIEF